MNEANNNAAGEQAASANTGFFSRIGNMIFSYGSGTEPLNKSSTEVNQPAIDDTLSDSLVDGMEQLQISERGTTEQKELNNSDEKSLQLDGVNHNLAENNQASCPVSSSEEKNISLISTNNYTNEMRDRDINKNQPKADNEEEIKVLKKSYDSYSEPNFDPFQTTSAVRNSPDPQNLTFQNSEEEILPTKLESCANKIDENLVPDPSFAEIQEGCSTFSGFARMADQKLCENKLQEKEVLLSTQIESNHPEIGTKSKQSGELRSDSSIVEPENSAEQDIQEENIIISQKTYNLDEFDDPNFNPFQTKSTVRNSPEPQESSLITEENNVNEFIYADAVELPSSKNTAEVCELTGKLDGASLVADSTNILDIALSSNDLRADTARDLNVNLQPSGNLVNETELCQLYESDQQVLLTESDKVVISQKPSSFELDNSNFSPIQTKCVMRNSPEPDSNTDSNHTVQQAIKEPAQAALINNSPNENKVKDERYELTIGMVDSALVLNAVDGKNLSADEENAQSSINKEGEALVDHENSKVLIAANNQAGDENEDKDEIIVPQKSYDFDFDKFDDPNFNPFQTKSAVRNSPEPEHLSTYKQDNYVDEPETAQENERNMSNDPCMQQEEAESLLVENISLGNNANDTNYSSEINPTQLENSTVLNTAFQETTVSDVSDIIINKSDADDTAGQEDQIVVPKKSYNFDFDQFDDPNFNPFQTKAAVRNSPEPLPDAMIKESSPEIFPTATSPLSSDAQPLSVLKNQMKAFVEMTSPKATESNVMVFDFNDNDQVNKAVKEKPVLQQKNVIKKEKQKPPDKMPEPATQLDFDKDEIIVPKKSYNFDFDKFDDPNFNPFESKAAVRNSPEPGEEPKLLVINNELSKAAVEAPLPKVVSQDEAAASSAIECSKADDPGTDSSSNMLVVDFNDSTEVAEKGLKKKPVLTKKRPLVKKKKNVIPVKKLEQDVQKDEEMDEIIVPTKSYNFDFDKFDDPNFNPFASKATVRNSPEVGAGPKLPEIVNKLPEVAKETPSPSTADYLSADDTDYNTSQACGDGLSDAVFTNDKVNCNQSEKELIQDQPPEGAVVNKNDNQKEPCEYKVEERQLEQDKIKVPEKSYNLDSGDPNLNPFQSKAAVSNSPQPSVVAEITLDDVINEKTQPETTALKEKLKEQGKQWQDAVKKKKPSPKCEKPWLKKNKTPESEKMSDIPPDNNDDQIIVPKKSYNIDFDKFDDPNFNPFESKAAVRNSPELSNPEPATTKVETMEQKSMMVIDLNDSGMQEETTKVVKKKPVLTKKGPLLKKKKKGLPVNEPELESKKEDDEDEMYVPKKSYNIDFDKFDDPNFNPFESKAAVGNSPEPKSAPPPEIGAEPQSCSAAPKQDLSKLKSRLAGLRRPIAKRAQPIKHDDDADLEQVSNPFAPSANSMRNSPPLPSNHFEQNGSSNKLTEVDSTLEKEEFSAVTDSSQGEEALLQQHRDSSAALSVRAEDQDMSATIEAAYPAASMPPSDFVMPDLTSAGSFQHQSDDAVEADPAVISSSAFRPFAASNLPTTAVRDDVREKSLRARFELLIERKRRLKEAIDYNKSVKKYCEMSGLHLHEQFKKKEQQIVKLTADYHSKLDDFHHVKSQVYCFTNRINEIQHHVTKMSQENVRFGDNLRERKLAYLDRGKQLVDLLNEDQNTIKRLRERFDTECSDLRDQFNLAESKLKKSQIELNSLEASLVSKSQQCEEMGQLCDELFTSVELNATANTAASASLSVDDDREQNTSLH